MSGQCYCAKMFTKRNELLGFMVLLCGDKPAKVCAVNLNISTFPDTTQNLSISLALPALKTLGSILYHCLVLNGPF